MKYLLLLFPLFSFSQNNSPLKNKVESQTVRVVVRFNNEKKESKIEFGMGIVLKGEYLSTCYHLIIPKDSGYKLSSVYVMYNERDVKGTHLYDSILATFVKANSGQYDFSKHIFSINDRKTDFVVLKLSKKLKRINYLFANIQPKLLDTLYTFGNAVNGKIINKVFQNVFFMFKHTQEVDYEPLFFAYISSYDDGFSGTPLYNTKGQILGIVQFSLRYKSEEFLEILLQQKQITKELYYFIINELKRGNKLQFAIDFNYLKNKYLKGYL